jgi:rubredoxin
MTAKQTSISVEKESSMQRFMCGICGYNYVPEDGDPDSDVKPGTPFEKVPQNWVCPVCGADKSNFNPL